MAPSASDVLRLDGNGNPRTLRLFASLVEAESRRFTSSAASQPPRTTSAVYVLAAAYLALFMRSPAALEAGIVVEPATAHRLVSVAVLIGAKFVSPRFFSLRSSRGKEFEDAGDQMLA
ncbi:hypothetical protein ZWY2020_024101 [Hordeum vulgare]|nr:hypothetical protein ZWY2020_024101 [Hordeum vulgare]